MGNNRLSNGMIMKYLNGQEKNFPALVETVNSVSTLETAKENILIIQNELACQAIAESEPILQKGIVAGAIAGATSAFLKATIDPTISLSPQTMLAHAFYGLVLGIMASVTMDNFSKPVQRFLEPCTSRLFHNKRKYIENLLDLAKNRAEDLKEHPSILSSNH